MAFWVSRWIKIKNNFPTTERVLATERSYSDSNTLSYKPHSLNTTILMYVSRCCQLHLAISIDLALILSATAEFRGNLSNGPCQNGLR